MKILKQFLLPFFCYDIILSKSIIFIYSWNYREIVFHSKYNLIKDLGKRQSNCKGKIYYVDNLYCVYTGKSM